MVGNGVDGRVEFLLSRLTTRELEAVQQRFRPPIMKDLAPLRVLPDNHRIAEVGDNPADCRWAGQGGSKDPPSKDTREFLDRGLIVSRNGITTTVELLTAVSIQQDSPDGKELEDLTGVVFIRLRG